MTDEIGLSPVKEAKPIDDIVQVITYLKEGKVLRVKQENQGDILVRFSPSKHSFTEISRDLEKESPFYTRYWMMYNVSLNSLMTFDVYLEDEYGKTHIKYPVNSIVEYTRDNAEQDVAMVKDIMEDSNGNYLYALTGETLLFDENKLKKVQQND